MSGLLDQMRAAEQARNYGLLTHAPQQPVTGRQVADAMQSAGLLAAPIPVVGDIAGLMGDAAMYAAKPEERTWGNYALTALGALPFVPSAAGKIVNRAPGKEAFDPRFGKTFAGGDPRKADADRIASLTTKVEKFGDTTGDPIDLARYVGHPYIISMSDRMDAGGLLRGINGVELNAPVPLPGGQGYMFNNPGRVWASGSAPVSSMFNIANDLKAKTGKDPLYIPWRMAPTGSDFASVSGEAMLSFAGTTFSKGVKKALDRDMGKLIPGWKGISDPTSIEQFRSAPAATRSQAMHMMDLKYGSEGMLTPGEARLAIADPKQLAGRDGQVMNVGMIDVGAGPQRGGGQHPYYPDGVPGRGLGTVTADHNAAEFLPLLAAAKGADSRNPPRTMLRAMEVAPRGGILSPGLLKALGY